MKMMGEKDHNSTKLGVNPKAIGVYDIELWVRKTNMQVLVIRWQFHHYVLIDDRNLSSLSMSVIVKCEYFNF